MKNNMTEETESLDIFKSDEEQEEEYMYIFCLA